MVLSVTNPVYFVPVCEGEILAWHQVPLNGCFTKQRQKKAAAPPLLLLCSCFLLNKHIGTLLVFHIFVKSSVCMWSCCHSFSSCVKQDVCLLYVLYKAYKTVRAGQSMLVLCPFLLHLSVEHCGFFFKLAGDEFLFLEKCREEEARPSRQTNWVGCTVNAQ